MNLSLFAFKFIDYGFDYIQNYSRYKGITVEKDIVYDNEHPDCCQLDVYYRKEDKKPYPVFLYIHGGGFIAGDKKHRRSVCSFIAEQGYLVVSINHGLCPDYKFPSFLNHVIKALNYINVIKEKHDINLSSGIVVGGDSSGGYISSMLGAMQANDELRVKLNLEKQEVKIKGLWLICGSYDMAELLSSKVPFKIAAEMGETITGIKKNDIFKKKSGFDSYEYVNELYPESYINGDFPTSYICHSDGDFFVPNQGTKFIELLRSKGVKAYEHHATRLLDLHCYPIFRYNKASKKCLPEVKVFLEDMKNN
jgi:acetyl esterase/lipase